MNRRPRRLLGVVIGLLVLIAPTSYADQKRSTTKKGSRERLEDCETNRKVCQDIGCSHYMPGKETPDEKSLIKCYDDCIVDYQQCMNAERRKGAAGAASKGVTGGVERSQ
jgi:hypothetical protein